MTIVANHLSIGKNDYKDILPELLKQGITYTLLYFSSSGRVRSGAIRCLGYSFRAAARRRGVADYRLILNRCRRNIGIAIQRRLVDHVRACFFKTRRGPTENAT